jgi:hypothetical protein
VPLFPVDIKRRTVHNLVHCSHTVVCMLCKMAVHMDWAAISGSDEPNFDLAVGEGRKCVPKLPRLELDPPIDVKHQEGFKDTSSTSSHPTRGTDLAPIGQCARPGRPTS